MNLKDNLGEKWRRGVCGAALVALLGLLGLHLTLKLKTPFIWELSYDLPFAFPRYTPINDVVIVSMDEPSYERLAQNRSERWDRALHVTLLEKLLAHHARLVVFDVLFDGPWPDTRVDQRFASLLRRADSKVALAASLQYDESRQTRNESALMPHESLGASNLWGIVELPLDADQTLRRHPNNRRYPSLSDKAAELLGLALPKSGPPRWINYYGVRSALREVSYYQVLEMADLPPDLFSNKVVYVGLGRIITAQGANTIDQFRTPFTRWTGHLATGVEIQATVFANLLRHDWLEQLAEPKQYALLAIGALLFGFGLVLVRPWTATVLAVLGVIAVIGGALVLVWEHRLWFPWMAVAGVQIPAALAWSVIAQTRLLTRENELLKKRLGSALETAELIMSPERASAIVLSEKAHENPAIPDHALLKRVGSGAYGEVWLARDIIGGYHAVKIIHRKSFPRPEPFEREFHGMQKFTPISRTHPGLLHILHVGRNEAEEYFYYVMEAADDESTAQQIDPEHYVPRTLSREIARRGHLPVNECVRLGLTLTAALEHLHQKRLIHRDIKPSNIVFVDGAPKFADIGLVTEMASQDTQPTRVGTAGFMAPEGPGTPAADVYSLGKVLYEASMGRDPCQFPEFPTTLGARQDQEDLRQLHEVIMTACETDPLDRYASAVAMHEALRGLQQQFAARHGTE